LFDIDNLPEGVVREAEVISRKGSMGRVKLKALFPQLSQYQCRALAFHLSNVNLDVLTETTYKKEVGDVFKIVRKNLPEGFGDVDSFLDKYCDWQDALKSCEVAQSYVDLTVESKTPILLVPIADIHLGNLNSNTRAFMEDVDIIKSRPYIKTIFAGDLTEGGVLPQMMDLVLEQIVSPKKQRQIVWELIEKILPNALVLITGQHDQWPQKTADFEWLEWFANEHDLNYMGWGGLIDLKVGEQQWKILARHKYQFNSSSNATNSAKQLMRMGPFGFADVAIVADKHTYAYESCELGDLPRAFLRPGSYKATDHFSQMGGYNFSRPYMPGIILWPDRRMFKGERDYRLLLPEIDAMVNGTIDWKSYPAEAKPLYK